MEKTMRQPALSLAAVTLSVALLAQSAPVTRGRALTRAERIEAQTAIERVFYNHRIWPKDNPAPKPSFEEMIPATLIEKKAGEPVRLSAALGHLWNIAITPAMLQAELDRMVRESRDRATLHELFTALGNDPYLIAETLARGNLAEQALRRQYAFDADLHAGERRHAEEIAARVKRGADWSGLEAGYSRRRFRLQGGEPSGPDGPADSAGDRLPAEALAGLRNRLAAGEPGALREDENGWLLMRRSADEAGVLEVESLAIAKRSFDDWWAETALAAAGWDMQAAAPSSAYALPATSSSPAAGCDVWDGTMGQTLSARRYHSAVWTGTEMIVWGGSTFGFYLNTGGRYNPASPPRACTPPRSGRAAS
jgi:hypothetical protein